MLLLLLNLLERVGFLIAVAFVFSRSKWMRSYMSYHGTTVNHWRFVALFSFFAVLGTYSGVTISEIGVETSPWIGNITETAAVANSRSVGVVIAGLLGGMKAGFAVGMIAGLHRYSLGGFVAFACFVAPMVQGVLAGMMRNALKKRYRRLSSIHLAFMAGILAESLQMGLVLVLAKPWEQAAALVSLVALPQILANGLGVALFFVLYMQIEKEEERAAMQLAIVALQIADMTLPHWKKPMEEAVKEIAAILNQQTPAVGASFLRDHEMAVLEGKKTNFWIDVPVTRENKKTFGTFRLYYKYEQDLNDTRRTVLNRLAQLLSQQYALAEAEKQAQLLADAEIRSLQAQMNPHFLFNVLNTIKSFIRTRPEEARQMITQLAKFLRQNMQNNNRPFISVREELEHVTAYLTLVKARKGDQLEVIANIEESLLDRMVPPFTIQPLVENAVVHGLKNIKHTGKIILTVTKQGEGVLISVEDNGVGMDLSQGKNGGEQHMGLALANIEQRLRYYYGTDKGLHIESQRNQGTKVSFAVR